MTDLKLKLDSTLLLSPSETMVGCLKTHPVNYSLPQPFYTDQHCFDVEMKQIFQKEWLFVGLTCEIPAKGNYISQQIGSNPIMIVRGDQGQVRAFHNVCRHRGVCEILIGGLISYY